MWFDWHLFFGCSRNYHTINGVVIFKFLDILLNNNPEEKLIVKLRPSIDFVKRLKEDKINKFYTTYFNLFEIPQSIARKYVYIKMVKEDIPLNYYDKLYKELRLEFGEIIKNNMKIVFLNL